MEAVEVGKVYQGVTGMRRKVEQISGLNRKVIIFQEINPDGSETLRCHYKGYKEFCKWAKQEAP
jgi:hypothetical protein